MMLKRLSALVMAMFLLVAGMAVSSADEVVELRVLNYRDMTSPNALQETSVVWEAFQAAHPNIKIVLQDEFNEPFHQATEAFAAAGTLPDVLYVWPSGRSTTLHTKKLLVQS